MKISCIQCCRKSFCFPRGYRPSYPDPVCCQFIPRREYCQGHEYVDLLQMYYEQEQTDLTKSIADSAKRLANMEQKSTDLHALLAALREMTDITELNQTMVNKLIQRIEVHSHEKKHSHNGVKVDIYFTAVGMVSIPDEKEILRIMEAVQARHKDPTKVVRLTA